MRFYHWHLVWRQWTQLGLWLALLAYPDLLNLHLLRPFVGSLTFFHLIEKAARIPRHMPATTVRVRALCDMRVA